MATLGVRGNMRKIVLGLIFGLISIGSVGTVIGLYVASQDGEADDEQPVVEAQQPPAATSVASGGPGPKTTAESSVVSTPIREPSPHAIPTVEAPATAKPTLTPTPTPEFGICPTPVRQTPEDFAEPPLPIEPPGQRVEGGTSFAEGYVTVHLPAGRQFIIQTGWSTDADGVYIAIYDVQAQSPMIIRGDGCETWRLVRDPTADLVFDEIMATLEVGTTYACPVPIREAVDQPPPQDGSGPGGRVVQGGVLAELGPITLHLPAGREFTLAQGLADPGGTSFGVYDVQTRSGLWLRPDGCEIGRRVSDPAADAVFDEIVATLEVER